MEDIIYEQESNAPENWITNLIFVRDNNGQVIEIEIPDDEEG